MPARTLVLVASLFLASSAPAAEPSAAARAEIAHLLDFLAGSGCLFYRNGSWHDAVAARAHLRGKYDALAARGMVGTAEDFITRAASESSTSGEPYRVRCGNAAPVPSARWLEAELVRYRKGQAGGK
jgi:Family of unknown function (DUF5329)